MSRWVVDAEGRLSITPSAASIEAAKAVKAERGQGNTIDPEKAWPGILCEMALAHYLTTEAVAFTHDGEVNDNPDFKVGGVAVEFKARSVYSRTVVEHENMADVLVETDAKTSAAVYAFGFYLEDSAEVLLMGAIDVRDFRARATKRTHSSKGVALLRPHLTVPLAALFPMMLMRRLRPADQMRLAM